MTFDWASILGTVFEYIVFPAVSAAAIYFITWIRAKKQELLQKTKDETTKKYLEMLDKTITDCTLATSQTYVDALKSTGSFDGESQKHAFQLTFDAVMAVLTDEAQKYLAEAVKDVPTYITTKIEAKINSNKS